MKPVLVDPPPKNYNSEEGFVLSYLEITPSGVEQRSILTGALNFIDLKTEPEKVLIEAALETEQLRKKRAEEFMEQR